MGRQEGRCIDVAERRAHAAFDRTVISPRSHLNKSSLTPSDPHRHDAHWAADFAAFGFYEPGFIHLRVETESDLSALGALATGTVSGSFVSTFLHEYVHFLQDITSSHGLLNFIHAAQFLQNANKQVLQSAAKEFSVPLRISNNFNWNTNARLMRLYRGDSSFVRSVRYLGYNFVKEEVPASAGPPINVEKYVVEYFDCGAHQKATLHFGSVHLKEYVAHVVQNEYSPHTSHDDVPYRIVEMLVEKECPRLARHPKLLVALCDAALMDQHPARLFFQVIERMRRRPLNFPATVQAVYTFAYDGVGFTRNGKDCTIESQFDENVASAIGNFRECLQPEIYKSNVDWFVALASDARKLRLTEPGFVTDLVTSPGKLSNQFRRIVDVLGTPFMTNADAKGYFLPPSKFGATKIEPYYPKVFQAITWTYRGEQACRLHSFCESRTDRKITNDQCLREPWARVGLPELCPYAQMWRTWGLEGRTPQRLSGDNHSIG